MRMRSIPLFPPLLFFILLFLLASPAPSPAESRLNLGVGDEVYACPCGPECDCGTLSRVANVCGCGRELVKARVVKTNGEEAVLLVGGKEKVFHTVGEYACECMENCGCGTISRKPGKCSCGRILLPLGRR